MPLDGRYGQHAKVVLENGLIISKCPLRHPTKYPTRYPITAFNNSLAALVDNNLFSALLRDPFSLADRFALTMPERRFLAQVQAQDLKEFAALAEGWITHQ